MYTDIPLQTFNMSNSYHNTSEHSTRQRLRPWLESRINSGDIPGLEWIDREQKIFKVPWKHVGNREWQTIDATIFKVKSARSVICFYLCLGLLFLWSIETGNVGRITVSGIWCCDWNVDLQYNLTFSSICTHWRKKALRQQCGKRWNCSKWAISPLFTMFSMQSVF